MGPEGNRLPYYKDILKGLALGAMSTLPAAVVEGTALVLPLYLTGNADYLHNSDFFNSLAGLAGVVDNEYGADLGLYLLALALNGLKIGVGFAKGAAEEKVRQKKYQ
jgi:hypothetical protein